MKQESSNTQNLKVFIQQIRDDAEREKAMAYKEADKRAEMRIKQRIMALSYAVGIPVNRLVQENGSTPTNESFELTPVPQTNDYGSLTDSIRKIIANIGRTFSSGDIYEAVKTAYPDVAQSSVSTTLIRLCQKGFIREEDREGRKIIYSYTNLL